MGAAVALAAFAALAVFAGLCADQSPGAVDPRPPPSDLEAAFEAAFDALEIERIDKPVALSPLPPYDDAPRYFTRFPGRRRWAWGYGSFANQAGATAAWKAVVERRKTINGWVTLEGPSDPPPQDGDAFMLELTGFRRVGKGGKDAGEAFMLSFRVSHVRDWLWFAEANSVGTMNARYFGHDEWSRMPVDELLTRFPDGCWFPRPPIAHPRAYFVRVERNPLGRWSGKRER